MPQDVNPYPDAASCAVKYAEAARLAALGGSIEEIERNAYITGDRATLALIEAAEDAAGLAVEESRERRYELRDTVRAAKAREKRIEELTAQIAMLQASNAALRNIRDTVEAAVAPFTGIRYGRLTGHALRPAPKWAAWLITALRQVQS